MCAGRLPGRGKKKAPSRTKKDLKIEFLDGGAFALFENNQVPSSPSALVVASFSLRFEFSSSASFVSRSTFFSVAKRVRFGRHRHRHRRRRHSGGHHEFCQKHPRRHRPQSDEKVQRKISPKQRKFEARALLNSTQILTKPKAKSQAFIESQALIQSNSS